MADTKYCYPNTNVLKNKLKIRDEDKLNEAERVITMRVEADLRAEPLKGNFDYAHLKNMHKMLFSEIYAWAGQPRTVDIGKGVQFAMVFFLEDNASKIFRDLKRDNYLIGLPYKQAIEKLAYYLGEINVLHPFREGNGRTQRLFITYLAQATGIELDFTKCDGNRMLEASKYSAIAADNTRFEAILRDIAEPMSLAEQKEFLKSVSPEALSVFEKCQTLRDRREELGPPAAQRPKAKAGDGFTMDNWKAQIAQERQKTAVHQAEKHRASKDRRNR